MWASALRICICIEQRFQLWRLLVVATLSHRWGQSSLAEM